MTYMPSFKPASLLPYMAPRTPVTFLTGSTTAPRSWIGMAEYLGEGFDIRCPDLPCRGAARDRLDDHPATLDEIAEAVATDLGARGGLKHLVGHGFGAVVALKVASAYPGRVASLTLIEPTAFNALYPATEESWHISNDVKALIQTKKTCLAEGDAWSAMSRYTDFTNGDGAWERTSHTLRMTLAGKASDVLNDLIALASDTMTPIDLAGVVCPVLLINGEKTPWHQTAIADELERSVPFVSRVTIDDAGHFPHLSDPHLTDPLIREFLVRTAAQWQDAPAGMQNAA